MPVAVCRLEEVGSNYYDFLNLVREQSNGRSPLDGDLAAHQSQPSQTRRGRHLDSGLRMVRTERTMISALDRIGREQLSPNKPVIL